MSMMPASPAPGKPYERRLVLCVSFVAAFGACAETERREALAQKTVEQGIPKLADRRTPQQPRRKDIIGQVATRWQVVEWANSAPTALKDLRGQVVFVRFWTDTCPYCERTMPGIQKLADEFRDKPVFFAGLYHSKPLGTERAWESAVRLARTWGVSFPIAYDREWRTVRSWWLDGARRSATSASFVIGADGRFVYVHPGPVFHPSDHPSEMAQDRDYHSVRAAILRALDARKAPAG